MSISLEYTRDAWQDPRYPVTGPPIDWNKITYIVIHYPGGRVPAVYDIPAMLRQHQINYLNTRGYSLGYGIAHPFDGNRWMIRGYDLRNAANNGEKFPGDNQNDNTISLFILVNNGEEASPKQIEAVRASVAECRRRAGRYLPIRPHNYSDYTICPGFGINAQINLGIFEPQAPTTPTIPQPPAGVDDVTFHLIHRMQEQVGTPDFTGFTYVPGVSIAHQKNGIVPAVENLGPVVLVDLNDLANKFNIAWGTAFAMDDILHSLIDSVQTVTPAPPCVWRNHGMQASWIRQAANEAAKTPR